MTHHHSSSTTLDVELLRVALTDDPNTRPRQEALTMTELFTDPTMPGVVDALDVVDAATRREFIAMLAAAGVLAACNDDDVDTSGSGAVDTDTPATTAEQPAGLGRVAAMTVLDLVVAFELGLNVVGGPGKEDVDDQLERAVAPDANYLSFGSETDLNLEAVAASNPDLLLALDIVELPADLVGNLDATVVSGTYDADYRVPLRSIASQLDLEDRAEEIIAPIDARIGDIRARLGDQSATSAVILEVTSPDSIIAYVAYGANPVLADIGFATPAVVATADPAEFDIEISLERLADVDADLIFVAGADPDTVATAIDSPAFTLLTGRLVAVSNSIWGFPVATAASIILDDIETAVA